MGREFCEFRSVFHCCSSASLTSDPFSVTYPSSLEKGSTS